MSDDTVLASEGIDRRRLLTAAGLGAAVVGAGVVTAGPAEAKGGKSIVLDVDTAGFADFEQSGTEPPGGTGAFYVSGDVVAPGTLSPSIGTFHCWGYIRADGLGLVNQEFDLNGRGKILIAGVESDAPRGVTGGTGHFANARGEGLPDVSIFDFPNSGKFRIAFSLTGAQGPPIT